MTLVRVRTVGKRYRRGPEEVVALRAVSFALDAGELVGLVGPSGSGKTTLLNVLAGWEEPDEGSVEWDTGTAPGEWASLAVVPQRLGLLEELSVAANVALPLRLLGVRDAQRHGAVGQLLDILGLAPLADRFPAEVSLGEQQRCAIARALVCAPQLVLADEPTSAQDEAWAEGVMRVLRAARAGGTTTLVATHSDEALALVDRSLRLHDGQLVG